MTQANKKLHLGCGSVNFPGWINIDLDSPTADLLLDLTQPLPFEDSSISHIFNEHFIEHVTREQAVTFLKECFRVLTPDGAIRITTPNLRFLAHSYFSNNINEWGDLWQPNSRCQMMNEGMRSWGHQFVYDAEELSRIIGEAGFNLITFQEYRASTDANFSELESRPYHNELIVEARKAESITLEIDFSAASENEKTWALTRDASEHSTERSLLKIELESVARAKLIDTLSCHIREIETALAVKESSTQDQKIRIHELEIALESKEIVIQAQKKSIDDSLSTIAQISKNLESQIYAQSSLQSRLDQMELKLTSIRSSWYGRARSFFNRPV